MAAGVKHAGGEPRRRLGELDSVLRRLLRSLRARSPASGAPRADHDGHPLALRERLKHIHARAPMDDHLRVLFGRLSFPGGPVLALIDRAIAESNTLVPPLKAIHRRAAALNLAQYFLVGRSLGGRAAECGVFSGCSALACCLAARAVDPAYAGEGFHLIDSFAGLSEPGAEDRIAVQPELGVGFTLPPEIPPGNLAAGVHYVRRSMREFPAVSIHEGWIPEVFGGLPEAEWSYVHVDVDLHAPTLAALEYFYPRLMRGGVVICDDYGAPTFPGARRAWDGFCDRYGVPFVVLPTGQSVILKA